jgi:hypothetical protein
MPLKIYVAKDIKGKEWAPDTTHEVRASEWMLKKAWEEFNHLSETYIIIVNLRHPSADMVVVTERGLGLLELKHNFGEIKINSDGNWMAGTFAIKAGNNNQNPREQVRSYAKELREKVIRWILPPYMQTNKDQWNKLKFQTAVCFAHPNAQIRKAQKYIDERRPSLEPWESNFSIIDVDSFTAWIRELRFQLAHDHVHTKDFEPVRLFPNIILKIATDVLGNREWNEIYSAMPTGNPYGYLILEDLDSKPFFNLIRDHSTVGRSPDCSIVIPDKYGKVSQNHCVITRNIDGVEVSDSNSRNGTYLNRQLIRTATKIQHGDLLTLGGEVAKDKVCVLKFELREQTSLNSPATEQATQSFNPTD